MTTVKMIRMRVLIMTMTTTALMKMNNDDEGWDDDDDTSLRWHSIKLFLWRHKYVRRKHQDDKRNPKKVKQKTQSVDKRNSTRRRSVDEVKPQGQRMGDGHCLRSSLRMVTLDHGHRKENESFWERIVVRQLLREGIKKNKCRIALESEYSHSSCFERFIVYLLCSE